MQEEEHLHRNQIGNVFIENHLQLLEYLYGVTSLVIFVEGIGMEHWHFMVECGFELGEISFKYRSL